MTKAKKTKRSLRLSVVSLLTCVAMLVGSTFAWFYDNASVEDNKIVAGNLKIKLERKVDGAWKDVKTAGVNNLFQPEDPWEPGQVVYEEFRISNIGKLAAKFAIYADEENMEQYCIVDPNTDEGTQAQYPYIVTSKTLGDMLWVAGYPGEYNDLVKAVNDELNLEGDDAYTAEDREVVKAAMDSGILPLYDNATGEEKYYFEQFYSGQDINGADGHVYFESGLLPEGKSSQEKWEFSYRNDVDGSYEPMTVENPSDKQIFTLIACWIPSEWLPDEWIIKGGEESDAWLNHDNEYNLVNGRKMSAIKLTELDLISKAKLETGEWQDGENGYLATEESLEGSLNMKLNMKFAITAFATQVEYEDDTFGNQYDENVWPETEMEE